MPPDINSPLAPILALFARPDVLEVTLESGQLGRVRRSTGEVPITKSNVDEAQIAALVGAGPLAMWLRDGSLLSGEVLFDGPDEQLVGEGRRTETGLRVTLRRGPLTRGEDPRLTAPPAPVVEPAPSPELPEAGDLMAVSNMSKNLPPQIDEASWLAEPISNLGHLVSWARAAGATDLHLASDARPRRRVALSLEVFGEVMSAASIAALVDKLIDAKQAAQLAEMGYADLAWTLGDRDRVRVNVGRHQRGLKICFRLVRAQPPTLAELGLPNDVANALKFHQGLIVVAGPLGHGKTTTLSAIVDLINQTHPHHIITVEDPIEVVYPIRQALISQREVKSHTASFARALKASLREDPDVIVIGELRDKETVEIALTAAETGHLVLATMSTRSAAKTIDRLIDLFPPEDQQQVRATLAGTLKMVVAQRLVPSTTAAGVVAACEILSGSVPLWTLIRDNKLFQLPNLMQRGRSIGMIRLDTSLAELVVRGTIAEAVGRELAEQPAEFTTALTLAKGAAS